MSNVKIYCLYNDERTHYEAELKGWRPDIFVEIDDIIYHISIYDFTRLRQTYEDEILENGFFDIDPNLVIVKEVNKKEIEFTVHNLFLKKYFEYLKPINQEDIKETLFRL